MGPQQGDRAWYKHSIVNQPNDRKQSFEQPTAVPALRIVAIDHQEYVFSLWREQDLCTLDQPLRRTQNLKVNTRRCHGERAASTLE